MNEKKKIDNIYPQLYGQGTLNFGYRELNHLNYSHYSGDTTVVTVRKIVPVKYKILLSNLLMVTSV